MIWYAAFGSNLLRARFLAYLEGGPVPGGGTPQAGSSDPTPPIADRPYRLPYPMLFANESVRWGGGVCFVDTTRPAEPAPTLGRAWLISLEQMADVWVQENSGVSAELDLDRLIAEGFIDAESGWYRRLHYLGSLDGYPVATITNADEVTPNRPTDAYLNIVSAGLSETWNLDEQAIATYLDQLYPAQGMG